VGPARQDVNDRDSNIGPIARLEADLARPGEVTAMVDPSVRAKALEMLGP